MVITGERMTHVRAVRCHIEKLEQIRSLIVRELSHPALQAIRLKVSALMEAL